MSQRKTEKTSTAPAVASATAAMAMAMTTAAWAGEISVLDWSGYEDEGFFGAYVEKHGSAPKFSYFADEDEALNKVLAGFSADVAHPCLGTLPKWIDAKVIQPIDTSRLEHWDQLLGGLSNLKGVHRENQTWMVPFDWGSSGLVYRTDKIDASNISLELFADPSMAGRVSIPVGVDDAYAMASLVVGIESWETMTDEQFQAANDFLRSVHKNVRFYWADQGQLDAAIASGEIDVAWAWNATEVALLSDGVPVKMAKGDIGVSNWMCGYVHMSTSDANDDAVYDYLNALTDPNSGKYIIEAWGYAHSNSEAFGLANQETVSAYGFGDPEGTIANGRFQFAPPPEVKAMMIREFERIKAGF